MEVCWYNSHPIKDELELYIGDLLCFEYNVVSF